MEKFDDLDLIQVEAHIGWLWDVIEENTRYRRSDSMGYSGCMRRLDKLKEELKVAPQA